MEKIKEKLKRKMKDEIAAYSILAAVFLTFIINFGIYTFLNANQSVETLNSSMNYGKQNETATMENLTSVENINSIEELQKLNEKELEEAEKKDEENKKEIASTPKYYIKVNYGAQVVTIYTKDSNGKYTKPVKAMVCSTGTYTPTSGVYKTPNRFRWLDMIGDVYAQYCTQIVGDILFHSVPYEVKYDNSSLFYKKYDQLGTRCSLGCIRLTCADAKWIYDNCKLGTQVEFYSSSNPGPLGKPSARKISNAPSYLRGWDPTDPSSNNPWREYLKKEQNKDKDKDKDDNKGNTITKPELPDSDVTNEITNEIVNETTNEIANEIANEIVNETTNEIINDIKEPEENPESSNMINEEIVINSV